MHIEPYLVHPDPDENQVGNYRLRISNTTGLTLLDNDACVVLSKNQPYAFLDNCVIAVNDIVSTPVGTPITHPMLNNDTIRRFSPCGNKSTD